MEKAVCCVVTLLQIAGAQVSLQGAENPFHWSAALSSGVCAPGETVSLRLKCSIARDHYLYKSKTSIDVSAPHGIICGKPSYSRAASRRDPATGKDEEVFFDSLTAAVALTVKSCMSDTALIRAYCSYVGCVRTHCYLPSTDSLAFVVRLGPRK